MVLDAFSRRVVGWSIDSCPQASLATSALAMAIDDREPHGSTIHSDHGTQFTSWAFTQRAKDAGLAVSMGSIGDCFDNAVIEAFWARMQVELLNRRRWRTRLELSNAIFEYLEIFHNRAKAALVTRHAHARRIRDPPGHHRLRPNNPTTRNAGHTRSSEKARAVHHSLARSSRLGVAHTFLANPTGSSRAVQAVGRGLWDSTHGWLPRGWNSRSHDPRRDAPVRARRN